jgi:peroxiredoxin
VFRRLSLLALLAVAACATASAPAAAPQKPTTLPAIDLVTLDGQPTSLSAAIGGRVAVVSLWATWCEACAAEFDALSRLSERAGARGATVMAVAVGEKRDTVAAFVARRALRYPQLVDEEFRLADALGQKRVPATLVIDREGKVTFVGGALDEHALAALRAALDAQVAAR